jgi:anthranilate synthase component 1
MFFLKSGAHHVLGASPEMMVGVQDGRVTHRPIAGTRRRTWNAAKDQAMRQELVQSEKERAEHVMLVDLGRNDLGRVCRPGSVRVRELMVIERYSHVMHIVSQVEGLLQSERDVWDLLMASFPAGTVSGAPKIRAMQLIHDLEPEARGPYSGVYGAVDLNGALNTAITIRTMVVLPAGQGRWRVQVQAGAGVVADSRPEAEHQETLNKARGMLKALACLQPSKAVPAGASADGLR